MSAVARPPAEPRETVMRVSDAFRLTDGRTILAGYLPADVPLVKAGDAVLAVPGAEPAAVRLTGESLPSRGPVAPGERLPPGLRSVTLDDLPEGVAVERVRAAGAELRLPPRGPGSAPPLSDRSRPITADDVESCFLRSPIGCAAGENALIYVLRSGGGPRPPRVWVTWSDAGQEPHAVYRDWEKPPAGVAARGGPTAEGIVVLREAFNRYSVTEPSVPRLYDFLAAFGLGGSRADRVLKASGVASPLRMAA